MTHGLKFVMWFSVLIALAAASPLHAALKPEVIYRRALPAVMTLKVENKQGERFVGSAFLALSDDAAVTAWHVIADARAVWATFADGQRINVIGCIDKDTERDLALIKLERKVPRAKSVLSPKLERVGARAYVIGAPRGLDFSISDGLISQIRAVDGVEQYQVSCPISPGNSGGPILNNRGEVIGVTSWRKENAQNVSFAIPVREIARLNASCPVTRWEQLAPSPASPSVTPQSPHRVSTPLIGEPTADSFLEFRDRLQRSAGKTVTLVIREGREEEKFTVTVPDEGLK